GARCAGHRGGDRPGRLGEERVRVGPLHVGGPGQRAHRDPAGAGADRAEAGQAVDVDDVVRRGGRQVEHRDEALPAGEHLAALPRLGQDLQRLAEVAGGVVLERRRLHPASLPTVWGARRAMARSRCQPPTTTMVPSAMPSSLKSLVITCFTGPMARMMPAPIGTMFPGSAKSTRFSIQILAPRSPIMPYRMTVIPPSTPDGVAETSAPNFGIRPKRIAMTPAM